MLLMNNDAAVKQSFVRGLRDTALTNAPATIGSLVCDKKNHARILSVVKSIDARHLLTHYFLATGKIKAFTVVVEVYALFGRGVFFLLSALSAFSDMRPRALPHYLADYDDVSVRVRKSAWSLLIFTSTVLYSSDNFFLSALAALSAGFAGVFGGGQQLVVTLYITTAYALVYYVSITA
jgi:hypothetical protein